MVDYRNFHANEFPTDRIYILLDEKFHNHVFNKLKRTYSFTQLNHLCNSKLNQSTLKRWRLNKFKFHDKTKIRFIPLWFIIKISEILKEYPIGLLERNIIAYKGPSSSSVIWNPRLPLQEDSRLLKILAHILGDGHAGGGFGSKLPKGKTHSEYRNFNKNLLETFFRDIQCFGDVPAHINYNHGSVIFPNSISYILKHIYKINFDSFSSRLPKDLNLLDNKLISYFIRAFADDEGHVYDNSIEIYSANRYLLFEIYKILKLKFPEFNLSKFKINSSSGRNPKYYFSIKNMKLYHDLIGFDHDGKAEDLRFNINREKPITGPIGKSRSMILGYLKYNVLTAKEISRNLHIAHSGALWHLNRLKDDGKVRIINKSKYNANLWALVE